MIRLIIIISSLLVVTGICVYLYIQNRDRKNLINASNLIFKNFCNDNSKINSISSCYVDNMISKLGKSKTTEFLLKAQFPTIDEIKDLSILSDKCISYYCT